MEEKSVPSAPTASPPTPSESSAPPEHEKPWQPRVDSAGRTFHIFANETLEADSILESPQVRAPEEDTAPLQGSKDRSDEDSLEPGD